MKESPHIVLNIPINWKVLKINQKNPFSVFNEIYVFRGSGADNIMFNMFIMELEENNEIKTM